MSQTIRIPLTPEHWRGLPLHGVHHVERERVVGKELPAPLLVYWVAGGTAIDVHRTARQHWHFHGQTGHFDFWARGSYNAIVTDAVPSHKLLVGLAPEITMALLQEEHDEFALEGCRFQFVDRLLERLLQRLATQAAEREPLGPLYTEALSVALLNRLALRSGRARRGHDAVAPLSAATRRNLVDLIESRLAAPPGIPDMALLAGLRTSDFLKAFRATFGSSPHQYLLERRIERAKHLLRQRRSLTAIALELGFASHAHFSATFRARTGDTPSEFRGNACPLEA